MELLSVELSEQPVDASLFSTYAERDFPKVVLGFQVNNLLDQKRLKFKSQYIAKNVMHFTSSTNGVEPVFFYGIELTLNDSQKLILQSALGGICRDYITSKDMGVFINRYQKRLHAVELSCDNCFKYLRDGVYPIDIVHLPVFSKNNDIPMDLLSMLEVPSEQWYLHMGAFGIYVLTTCASYNLGV